MGVIGVLTLYRFAENTFSSEELAVLAGFGPALAAYLAKDSESPANLAALVAGSSVLQTGSAVMIQ